MTLALGLEAEKLHLGHLGSKDASSRQSWTLAQIFINRTLFSLELKDESTKTMKSKKIS